MHPVVENAPGLTWRPCKRGWVARWQARTDLIERGYMPKGLRVWIGIEPTDKEREYIVDRCQSLQDDMLIWGRGGLPAGQAFDHTVAGLVRSYNTDPDSNYRKLRFHTRKYYDTLCRRIVRDHPDTLIADLKARQMLRWHETLSEGGKVAMSHGVMGMMRTLLGFGMTILEDDECARLSLVLHKMRFPMAKARLERLTLEQVVAIRAEAHRRGQHSIALAQAVQFEVILRQKDVIGEWVPISEPGVSDVVSGNAKWLRGLRREEIDDSLTLRHITSKRQKAIEVNLRNAPMVMEELAYIPAKGPLIVSEATGEPYVADAFRRYWRLIADSCGVPKTVRNMDSRAGAISEATDAGAELEHVRHAATHSDIAMTQRYSRGDTEKTANVQRARSTYRDKNGK